jgi:hypothetical protein
MSRVVITTPLAERFPATPGAAVGTDRPSAVSTNSHGTIATGRPYVAVTCSVFDLAIGVHLLTGFSRSNFRGGVPFGLGFSAPFLGVSVMHLFHFLCNIWMCGMTCFVMTCTISSHDPADNFWSHFPPSSLQVIVFIFHLKDWERQQARQGLSFCGTEGKYQHGAAIGAMRSRFL